MNTMFGRGAAAAADARHRLVSMKSTGLQVRVARERLCSDSLLIYELNLSIHIYGKQQRDALPAPAAMINARSITLSIP